MSSTIDALLRESLLARGNEIVAAYLFGSHARGTTRPGSDVDVGVWLHHAPPPTLLGQPFALEDTLRGDTGLPVQLVVLNTAPVDLIHRVLRDGILLLDHAPGRRIQLEVAARNAYFDLKPFLDRYRRSA